MTDEQSPKSSRLNLTKTTLAQPGKPTVVPGAAKSKLVGGMQLGDPIFKGIVIMAGTLVMLCIAAIAYQLVAQAIPAISQNNINFLTGSEWHVSGNDFDAGKARFGVLNFLKVTVLSSVFALLLAVPVAVGIAIFLVQYAPKKLSRSLGAVIDLLAAVPSIVYGIWGVLVLSDVLTPITLWLNENFGWFFLFKEGNLVGGAKNGGTVFVAGVILAIMILPIITSISREVLRQTPVGQQEAALALGATKWETIRTTFLPYGRSGIISASMLALGRALGETIAVMFVLAGSVGDATWSLFDGGYTFASKIASGSTEFVADENSQGAYITAGLVLFILTLVVNTISRAIAGGKVNG